MLIITSDHDTGGMQLTTGPDHGEMPTVNELREFKNIAWVSNNHTASPILLFGLGPGAEMLRGIHDNTDVAKIIRKVMQ